MTCCRHSETFLRCRSERLVRIAASQLFREVPSRYMRIAAAKFSRIDRRCHSPTVAIAAPSILQRQPSTAARKAQLDPGAKS